MILYLDTSAFLKLYLEETGSDFVRQAVDSATAVYTHLITYAEMQAGLARAVDQRRLPQENLIYQTERFDADWNVLHVVQVTETLVRRAGELARAYKLRGYDSVQLAGAEQVFKQLSDGVPFCFMAFDKELQKAARTLSVPVTR